MVQGYKFVHCLFLLFGASARNDRGSVIKNMKDFAKTVYKRKQWKHCRAAYIREREAIDGGMCEKCHERLGYIVHHEIPLTPENVNDPGIVYNHEHLKYVCKLCHDQYDGHGVGGKPLTPLLQFDDNGDPILPPPIKIYQSEQPGTVAPH